MIPALESLVARHLHPVDQGRFQVVRAAFAGQLPYLRGRVLDFGAGDALSMVALHDLGITEVDGVDVVATEVERGRRFLEEAGLDPSRLGHVADTRALPFPDECFDAVVANAVLEHIPQPRDAHIREVWRVLRPGGFFLISETPNKYLPLDFHTTGLLWVPWLPGSLARSYAVWRGRFSAAKPWESSGWRGLGHFELVSALPSAYRLIPEVTRTRHRVLRAPGLPAGLVDPYPQWILQKQ